eukprot:5903711-Amphidinium_carterae.1
MSNCLSDAVKGIAYRKLVRASADGYEPKTIPADRTTGHNIGDSFMCFERNRIQCAICLQSSVHHRLMLPLYSSSVNSFPLHCILLPSGVIASFINRCSACCRSKKKCWSCSRGSVVTTAFAAIDNTLSGGPLGWLCKG